MVGGPRRILIIDDNVGLAENIAEILQIAGHVTEVAASAEEALSKALPINPNVVVTDYRLPDTNGANLLRQFRRMGMHVRSIVISAHTDESTIEDARSAGAAFLAKPLDFKILGRLILEASA
jgi:DNA-binding NtrC family response regulator